MTSCTFVKPLISKMTCPFCQISFSSKDVKDYNDNYVRCPNTECMVSFIPRSSELKHRLLRILLKFVVIECSNTLCNTEYYAYCVPHNEFYSVCPKCETKNSHNENIRENARVFSDIENYTYRTTFRECESCNKFFDTDNRPQKKNCDSYDSYDYLCCDCLLDEEKERKAWHGMGYDFCGSYYPISNYYWQNGHTIEKISIHDYPRIKVNEFSNESDLIEISKQYLPTIPSQVREAKRVTIDQTISKNTKKKAK